MRIVVDTNGLISGVFFGGFPRRILNAVVESRLDGMCYNCIGPMARPHKEKINKILKIYNLTDWPADDLSPIE